MKVTHYFIAVIVLVTSVFNSCGPSSAESDFEKQTELKIIDSLSKEIDSVLYLIDIDADEINERYVEMDSNLRFFKLGVDSMPDELAKDNVIFYHGISRNYKTFLKQYAEIVKESEVTFNRLKTLKKSVEMNEYVGEKELFKKHRTEIETEIRNIINNSNQYIATVHNVEAGYQRISMEIEKLLIKLKKD